MPEDIASEVVTVKLYQVELEQLEHGPTIKSVVDATHFGAIRHLLLISLREGNTQDDKQDDNGQRCSMPLGVPLTGNRLFTISWILGLGILKAIYSYRGQSLVSTTLDLLGGIILTLT
jgi:hypothetical protein